ncbi:glutathione S-transferase family protein [Marivibrio halodurans]|uniref:Glutathione S-transferase family protein n=1 Tax=Marivibrio halodurans TaxID=2039722 RepID=A0A8J7SMZ5_9PROT|nr:glutathione S-transferase family protein [Marivibrio halodurans]MBP5857703.1 glutathione S-transferase family protein [Marivibrio halodurans]
MLTLHDCLESGNGHKVRLLLALLGRDFRLELHDIHSGGTHRPAFLALNPNGKIPVLQLEDGRCLPESNAILCYLAEGTAFLPEEPFARAQCLSWLFWEQYNHEPNVAVARFWCHHLEMTAERRVLLAKRQAKGHAALKLMDDHLTARDWLVGDGATVADIALYSYTSVSAEGGIKRDGYPALTQWLARVEALPGFIAMAPWNG